MSTMPNDSSNVPSQPERRSFFAPFGAIVCGAIVAIFPFAASWRAAVSPLRRNGGNANSENADEGFVRICSLDALPPDGTPRPFPVATDVVDAWTRWPQQRVGEVYLARSKGEGAPQLVAFTATCPHLGCAIEFDAADDRYVCPCHESGFALNGDKLFGPSLRGLDPLEVRIKGDEGLQEVWVRYERFRAGVAERIPIA